MATSPKKWAKMSARPTMPATASVWTGCTAKRAAAENETAIGERKRPPSLVSTIETILRKRSTTAMFISTFPVW
jgi:hypothetical protein